MLIQEINSLSTRAQELIEQSNQRERELAGKDFARDRTEIIKIAQAEIALFEEGATLWRAAADKAVTASRLGLPAKQKQYFNLIAQYNLKCAELLDALRERAEALLSTESSNVIEAKRNDAQTRADKLHQEADELQKAIDKLMH